MDTWSVGKVVRGDRSTGEESELSATLEAEAERISSESGVPVDIHLSDGHGFDGLHTALAVVTVLAGGVGGGILAAVGKDVWSRVKRLVRKAKEAEYRCTVVVVRKIGDTEIRYRCEVDRIEDVDRMVKALENGHADVAPSGAPSGTEPVVLRLDDDGVWKPAR
jgi:hypothetical protein